MSDEEWLTTLADLIEARHDRDGPRKLRLFACACARESWSRLADKPLHDGVEISERFADGSASLNELAEAGYAAFAAHHARPPTRHHQEGPPAAQRASEAAWRAASIDVNLIDAVATASAAVVAVGGAAWRHHFLDLASCIFAGTPGAPDPRWLTSTVVDLAKVIYEERAFDRLPILADALMDAGCDEDELLKHCRCDVPHARGCWVVDLLLGRR
jgi:hypothetical protein